MSPVKRTCLATAAASAVALYATPATATEPLWASGGLSFSLSFGREVEVGVVLDVRMTVMLSEIIDPYCSSPPPAGMGPYGQAGWYSRSGWRFGAGVHGGGELDAYPAGVDGEIGWSYRRSMAAAAYRPPAEAGPQTGQEAGDPLAGSHGLHLGINGQVAPPELKVLGFQLPLALDIPLSSPLRGPVFATGLGLRIPGIFAPHRATCVIGRPLRAGGQMMLSGVQVGAACAHRDLDSVLRQALAAAWLEDARTECASIPVFVALARDLMSVGAPPALVAWAQAAAQEEVQHTLLCSELASGFAGVSLSPQMPAVPVASERDRLALLCRLATEALQDGCIGEGAAARQAQHALRGATDPAVRRALAIIARDEASHAALAWAVLSHCLRRPGAEGREVRALIAAQVRAGVRLPTRDTASGPPWAQRVGAAALRDFGRIPQAESDAIWRCTARDVHAELGLLLTRPTSRPLSAGAPALL